MARPIPLQVVTANALVSGRVVWLTPRGGWTACMAEAAVFDDPAQAKDALCRAEMQSDRVVGPYLARVRQSADSTEPAHFREAFRRDGPSDAARIPRQPPETD